MANKKVRTTVHIGDQRYTLSGVDSEEYMHRVAIHVDRMMQKVKSHNTDLPNNMIAVLTAINIADEYLRAIDLAKVQRVKENKSKSTKGDGKPTLLDNLPTAKERNRG